MQRPKKNFLASRFVGKLKGHCVRRKIQREPQKAKKKLACEDCAWLKL
jgi:hypothetical protein